MYKVLRILYVPSHSSMRTYIANVTLVLKVDMAVWFDLKLMGQYDHSGMLPVS